MTTREQIAVRIAEWDRQQVPRDVSYQKSADEIIAIAIKSQEAKEYWKGKHCEVVNKKFNSVNRMMCPLLTPEKARLLAIKALKEAQSE